MTSNPFARVDESNDRIFYQAPRLVQHIDDGFIAHLQELLREVIPPQAEVLDLMSSWVSHLPTDLVLGKVTGLGMNQVELAANPQLHAFAVQNLNENPVLPYGDQTFDIVLNTVSIQYVTQPLALVQEIHRVLKPGGQAVVSFSNRMFPTKAVEVWRTSTDDQHMQLVRLYFERAEGFDPIREVRKVNVGKGLNAWFMNPGDPFYAVVAQRAR